MNTTPVIALLAALAIGLGGCAAAEKTGSASNDSAAMPAAGSKVDPNKAEESDIAKTLKANGVSNSDKWADEIKEYRPYTKENLASKLTEKLGKYNVSADDLKKILASLEIK